MTKRNWALLIISLGTIYPFAITIMLLLDVLGLANIGNIKNDEMNEILGRTISDRNIVISLSIFVVLWTASLLIVIFWKSKKNRIDRVFSHLSLFLGGLGLHLIFLPFLLKFKKVRRTKFGYVIGSTLAISAPVVALCAFSFIPSFSDANKASPIVYSTNRNAANLIEIFPDGLDKEYINNRLKNKPGNFSDFLMFDKYVPSGIATHRTMPTIYGGIDYNVFSISKERNIRDPYNLTLNIYGDIWYKTGLSHLDKNKTQFSSRSILNPILFSTNGLYGATTEGTAKDIVKKDPTLNVVNWKFARDENAGSFGVSKLSPDEQVYKWATNTAKSGSAKGARVLLNDLANHSPHLIGENHTLQIGKSLPAEEMTNRGLDLIEDYFNKLKSMVDPITGVSVYDNSMIVMYGDHAAHGHFFDEGVEYKTAARQAESALMIKYPHQSTGKHITNRLVYSSQINGIIDDYFKTQSSTYDPNAYLSNHAFDIKPVPLFISDDSYIKVDYSGNKIIPYMNSTPVKIDFNIIDDQIKEIKRMVMR